MKAALLLLLLLPATAFAEHLGVHYHGAGGPYLFATTAWLGAPDALVLGGMGGSGYSYHRGGRLRVGGGGQGASLSTTSDGWRGGLGRGYLTFAIDPLGDGEWEFPLGVQIGGGSWSIERVLLGGAPELVERKSGGFFGARVYAGVERRLNRIMKVAFELGWLSGTGSGGSAHELTAVAQIVFMLPRPDPCATVSP